MSLAQTHDLIETFSTHRGRIDPRGRRTASMPASFPTSSIATPTSPIANTRGWCFSRRLQLSSRWNVNGHYTLQIKNDGNYEGEITGTPGATSRHRGLSRDIQRRQELSRRSAPGLPATSSPALEHLQRGHGPRGRRVGVGSVASGLRSRLFAGRAKPGAHGDAARDSSRRPAIRTVPAPTNVFFGDRGSQEFAGYGVLDMSFNYNVPVFRTLRPWVKFDVLQSASTTRS